MVVKSVLYSELLKEHFVKRSEHLCCSEYIDTEGLLRIQEEDVLCSVNERKLAILIIFCSLYIAHLSLWWLRTTTLCYGGQYDEEDNGWDHPTENRDNQYEIRVEIIMDLVEDFIERILISFLAAELIRPQLVHLTN